jgi:hypothetical protein
VSSRPLEFILARQWSELLSVPVLLFDPELRLVFFNDAAGLFLGRAFNETGSLDASAWRAAFPITSDGEDPLERASACGVPVQCVVMLEGLSDRHRLRLTVWPFEGLKGDRVGLMATLHPATS